MFKPPCCWLKKGVSFLSAIWEKAQNMLEKGKMHKNTGTHVLDAPPDAVQRIIHCSRRDVEGVWWLQSSPGQGSSMDLAGCTCAQFIKQRTAQPQGWTLRCKASTPLSATYPVVFPAWWWENSPDQSGAQKWILPSRGERLTSLFNSRWVLLCLDSHRKHHDFWSCFNKESHVHYVTIHRTFHLQACYIFRQ